MKLTKLGICGIISLLSYTAMVVFSPLVYPGYDWLSMAVSELSAVGAPSAELAGRLNMTQNNLSVTLSRIRKKLKSKLIKEGFSNGKIFSAIWRACAPQSKEGRLTCR